MVASRWLFLVLCVGCAEIEFTAGNTSAGGAASGGAPSGGSGAGAGGGAPVDFEICGNGVDDDADGDTDCNDSDCTDSCEGIPAGWTGLILAPQNGRCPASSSLAETVLTAVTGNGACACQCAAASACSSVTLSVYGSSGCSGSSFSLPFAEGACTVIPTDSVRPSTSSATCSATAELVEPDVSSSASSLCATPEGTCIYQLGLASCPPEFPNQALTAHEAFDDTRACETGTCSCSAACGVSLEIWDSQSSCSGSSDFTIAANDCQDLAGTSRGILSLTAPSSCPAAGSPVATGAVTATGPVTVCCAP